jgi:hypothetical protein
VLRFNFSPGWSANWMAAMLAIAQSVLFWGLAAVIFNRKDIAVPVE